MAENDGTAISRREFARRAVIASAVASIAPGSAVSSEATASIAQSPQVASPGVALPALPQAPSDLPKLAAESQAEADSRYQAILATYGARFSEEQKSDLQRLCRLAQAPLERLRAYPMQNGDGPGLYLKPLFEREKKAKVAGPPAKVESGAASDSGTRP